MLRAMFYLQYMVSELRRRKGRTLLTALGLGVGVGLVVTVTALTTGLDRAQDKVLEPLTGVGTDMAVTRPLTFNADAGTSGRFGGRGAGLSAKEQEQLRQENGGTNGPGARLRLGNTGNPGDKFTRTNFIATSQLSFPASEVSKIAKLNRVQDAAGALTLNMTRISGTVPEGGFGFGPQRRGGQQPQGAAPSGRDAISFNSMSLTGIDETKPSLAPMTPDQVSSGKYFSSGSGREVILNAAYAKRNSIEVGGKLELKGSKKFTVVGLAESPLGGQSSDGYVKLSQLQSMSDRKGRVNTVQVRAAGSGDVAAVKQAIGKTLDGASVTTAADLAKRVGGSLSDAKKLSSKLGTALTIVGLLAAFLIASLLTLSSVTKRIRELGTLKAIGWPQRHVVRQVAGESLLQGALGGIAGAVIGIAGAAVINMIAPTLEATVAAPARAAAVQFGPGGPGGPGGGGGGFGSGAITSGSTHVTLNAPVDVGLIVLAIALALLGGLIAGSVGGLRVSRLRPADALRHID
jgi:ABC-type antimicrobial peptide transport system permease subunit